MPSSRRAAALPPLLLALAACGPALEPQATPAPAATPPAAAEPAGPAAAARAFAYGPGTAAYDVERRATIEVAGDTGQTRDTVVTTALVRVSLAATRLAGTVDSFAVASGAQVPAAPPPALPLPFAGTVQGGRVTLDASVDDAATCRPDAAVLAAVGEIFPLVAERPAGARWADTVIAESCRGGVRLTTVAVHEYRAEGAAGGAPGADGLPLVRVARTTTLTVRGAGRMARTAVTAEGDGSGHGTFLLDPAAGRLVEGRTETTLQLTFDAAGRTERVTQRAETLVRRR